MVKDAQTLDEAGYEDHGIAISDLVGRRMVIWQVELIDSKMFGAGARFKACLLDGNNQVEDGEIEVRAFSVQPRKIADWMVAKFAPVTTDDDGNVVIPTGASLSPPITVTVARENRAIVIR